MNLRFAQGTVDFFREMGLETHLFDLEGHPKYEGITHTVMVCGEVPKVEVEEILSARLADARFTGEDDTIPDEVHCIWVPEGVFFI